MEKLIFRAASEALRDGLSWHQRWEGKDKGLIACWEAGRVLRERDSELSERCGKGELPILPWRGGIGENAPQTQKYGTLNYLAQWQGIRGDDLEIDMAVGVELTCSRTGALVIYTQDAKKYVSA